MRLAGQECFSVAANGPDVALKGMFVKQSTESGVGLFALAAAALCVAPASANAQGTTADYARANGLAKQLAGKVYRTNVTPNWIDANRFWYRNDLPGGRREFVLVDPAKAEKRPAFDATKLAAALTKTLGKPIDPAHIPVERIAFDAQSHALRVQVGDRTFGVGAENYALTESDAVLGQVKSLSLEDGPRRSRDGGPDALLTFVNHSHAEVALFWLDSGGEKHEYGSLRPEERRQQHTFAGHVWLITGKEGKEIALFVTPPEPSLAVIETAPPTAEHKAVSDPNVSPDGKRQIVFHDDNLFLRDVGSKQEAALTTDGKPDDRYEGQAYWSLDNRHVVVMKVIPAQPHPVSFVESSPKDQLQPKLHTMEYLKPGDRIAHPRPHLFDVETRRDIPIDDSVFPNPWDIDNMDWTNATEFTFLYNQRGHQAVRVVAVNVASGTARTIIDEQARTFVDWTNKVYLNRLPKTHEAVWMSERDGWNHLYLYDTETGQVKNQITKGAWVVRGVERVDADKRQIWFRAGGIVPGQDPYYIHYCRVNFDGSGLTVLTEGDGTHTVAFSPDNQYLVDTYSRVDLSPVSVLRRVSDGAKILELEQGDDAELRSHGWSPPERFTAKARDGKTDIYGLLFRPMNFDPNRKYPVIEQIYAGPQSAYVPKNFAPFHNEQALAELGFVVVFLDGMGTNWRSKAFHDVCWKNLADAGFPDRIAWIKAAAATRPYMDLTRVGIYGTSAGGQNALGGLLLHGDFYQAGVADCGCHDNRMDKIWWNEQWMGWPVGPEYAASSNVTLAPKLNGKLLLMVGEEDTNVDPASTMQVVNALIKADKDFELLVVPGAGHGVAGSPYGKRRLQDFFVRNLLRVEPRSTPTKARVARISK